ncbi:MAG: hypothetical protein K0R37_79, partial [Arthrobacter sp.]|nr:hypothetical protein [Arthrobacter sp.]
MTLITVQEQHLPGSSLEEKFDTALAWGFDGIELRSGGELQFAARLPELRRAKNAGVVMPTACVDMTHFIGAFDDDLRKDAVAQLKSQLSTMAEIGGRGVMTPASYGMFSKRLPPFVPPRTDEEDTAVLVEALTVLGEHAASEGVEIYLEPLNRYEDHMINRLADLEPAGTRSRQHRLGAVRRHPEIHRLPGHGCPRVTSFRAGQGSPAAGSRTVGAVPVTTPADPTLTRTPAVPSAGSIAARATAVLEANWRKTHTVPAAGLYPHQWSWDSSFIAMGLSRISPRRAGQEMDALFAGQWEDGRLPQIIFDPHRDKDYAPGASFWQSRLIPGSPERAETAGFIQPPNHAWAVWKIHQADPDESRRRSFLVRNYPKLVQWHGYLAGRR